MYALLLAIISQEDEHAADKLEVSKNGIKQDGVEVRLLSAAEALESDDPPKRFKAFVEASAEKTNTSANRRKRIETLAEILAGE